MNERIKELAEQAGFYVAGSKIYISSTSEDITTCQTKFAELIAAGVINKAERYGLGCDAIEQLKEDFGVEE
jgi:hypothetical protein